MRTTTLARFLALPVLASGIVSAASEPPVDYTNHALVRVTIRDQRDLLTMQAISGDMWSHGVRPDAAELAQNPNAPAKADYRVAPEAMPALMQSGLVFEVLNPNLQAGIDAERARVAQSAITLREAKARGLDRARPGAPDGPDNPVFFLDYRDLPAIYEQLSEYEQDRANLVEFFNFGQSIEGRQLQGLRITNEFNPTGRCRPALFITGTQHAREWISPMTCMYLLERLVYDYGIDPTITDLLDRTEIYILPVSNPDGYLHSWGPDRYWRKNRRPNANGSFGVDLNRNWGYKWGVPLPGNSGGNNTQNSQTYWGTGPFSEPETADISEYALSKPNIRWQLDVHSYGQLILHPWGWTNAAPPQAAEFTKWGTDLAAIIKAVNNKTYTPGTMYTKLYPVSGGNTDWYFVELDVPSFLIELPGPDFVVPPSLILPTGNEILPAVLYMAQQIADRYPFLADFTNDCQYNIDDFIAFQTSYSIGEARADLDGDGQLSIDDFITFQTLYSIGG
jgi:murein tripeptide amidase MpaA